MRSGVVVILLLLTAAQASAEEMSKDQTDCAAKALSDYVAQGLALSNAVFQRKRPVDTVADVLARRRLEESYCARFVRCIGTSEQIEGVQFSKCLDLEAEERHNLSK